jgi:hypothetical protein
MELEIKTTPDFEYIEGDESTWRRFTPPHLPSWVNDELIKIAGLNRHGQPNLRCVWAADMESDRTEFKQLKYSCGYSPTQVSGYKYQIDGVWHFTETIEEIDPSVFLLPSIHREELGLPRFVIEQWISPEELERQGRYQHRYDGNDLHPTLRKFPREGIYDLYLIVENAAGLFRQVDRDVANFVKMKWNYDFKPFEDREADKDRIDAQNEVARRERQAEIWDAANFFDMKLPKDEKERRDHYWATLHDYQAEAERLKHRKNFYYANTNTSPA